MENYVYWLQNFYILVTEFRPKLIIVMPAKFIIYNLLIFTNADFIIV